MMEGNRRAEGSHDSGMTAEQHMLRAALLPQGHVSLQEADTKILLFSLSGEAKNHKLSPSFNCTQATRMAIITESFP